MNTIELTLAILFYTLTVISFVIMQHINNKKLQKIKKAELLLSVKKSMWHMSLFEGLKKSYLTQELEDAKKLLLKAVKEERYEDAVEIKKSIDKYLDELNK